MLICAPSDNFIKQCDFTSGAALTITEGGCDQTVVLCPAAGSRGQGVSPDPSLIAIRCQPGPEIAIALVQHFQRLTKQDFGF